MWWATGQQYARSDQDEGGKASSEGRRWEIKGTTLGVGVGKRVKKTVQCQKVERVNGPFAWQFWKHDRQLLPTE